MTSVRKITANGANAKVSTGPKSAYGKSRAAQNARRHGLSLPAFSDPVFFAEVEKLTGDIAGDNASLDIVEHARRIAEAQIDLMRVRQARHELLRRGHCKYEHDPAAAKRKTKEGGKGMIESAPRISTEGGVVFQKSHQDPKGLVNIFSELTSKLLAMDRYERRALSRRKFAIRALDLARRDVAHDPKNREPAVGMLS